MSEWNRLQGVLGWAPVWDYKLRQYRPVHVDGLPVHHSGGLDGHALLGPRLSGQDLAMVLLCHHGRPRILLRHESHSRCSLRRIL